MTIIIDSPQQIKAYFAAHPSHNSVWCVHNGNLILGAYPTKAKAQNGAFKGQPVKIYRSLTKED